MKDSIWRGYLNLQKVDAEQRIVEGFASTEEMDSQPGMWMGQTYTGDMVMAKALAEALPDYMEWANLREMHELNAVGTVLKAEIVEGDVEVDGRTYHNPMHIVAKIVDDGAWKKVKEGVYKGFSIGGKVVKAVLAKLDGKTIRKVVKLLLHEISLVDRPANPDARILLWKSFSLDERTQRLRDAWRAQFRSSSAVPPQPMAEADAWVTDVLNDQVIVETSDGLYAYPFTEDVDGKITFDSPVKVHREYVTESPALEQIQKKSYPWSQCIADQTKRYGSEETARKVCGTIRHKYGHKAAGAEGAEGIEPDIVYDGDLDFILSEIETDMGITPVKVNSKGGDIVKPQANIQKAADSSKVAAQLQALRDEAELGGDLEGAGLYSQAIALLLQAAGESDSESGTPPEEQPPEGKTPPEGTGEEELQMAAKSKLQKAGRTFSGPNAKAMHGVIEALAKMLAGTGDETAVKVAACYAPPAETPPADAPAEGTTKVAAADELQKVMQPALDGLQKTMADVVSRLEAIEHMPAGGGPVLRSTEKTIAGQGAPQKTEETPKLNVAALRKAAAIEPDPLKKQELVRQLFIAEHATVEK